MLPANSSADLSLPVSLSWIPGINTTKYDLYIWPENENRPATAYVTDITDINIRIGSGLQSGIFYKWQVVAKNDCLSTDGPVQKFSVNNALDLPDLTITSLQYPSDATAGRQITVSWTVKNNGLGSTNTHQWEDYIYLSTDLDLRIGDDILLGSFSNQSFLQPGQSYTNTKTITLPDRFTGTYYLFVITDNKDAYCWTTEQCNIPGGSRGAHGFGMAESNENNNYQYNTILINYGDLPDLKVTSLGVPTSVFGGSSIAINYKVTNVGTIAAVGTSLAPCPQLGWFDRYFISADSVFSRSRSYEFTPNGFNRNFSNCLAPNLSYPPFLAADGSYTISQQVEIPYDYFGNYYIYVVTNGFDEVFEGPYNANNSKRSDSVNVILTPPADLVISNVAAPATGLTGQKVIINWTVLNDGGNAPRETTWVDSIYISTSSVFDRSNLIKVGANLYSNGTHLQPGNTYNSSFEITLPNDLTGTYYVYVKTDAAEQVFEYSNEGNNVRRSTNPINISLSPVIDLTVTQILAPLTVKAQVPFNFKWTVKNIGPGNLSNQSFNDNIYCSTDSVFGSNQFLLATHQQQNNLLSGQEIANEKVITVPEQFGGKKVYFFVFTDGTNRIYEHLAEGNNRLSSVTSGSSGFTTVLPVDPVVVPIVYKPDLKINSFITPSTGSTGNMITVNWQVTNQGAGKTTANNWQDRVLLSNDTIVDVNDIQLAQVSSNTGLMPGGQYNKSADTRLPFEIAGSKYLILVTDYTNSNATDSIASNNTAYRAIDIAASPNPDLVVSFLSNPPAPLYTGSNFYLNYSIKNEGPAATGLATWYDGVYFSTSGQISTSSVQAASNTHNGILAPGESYTDSILVSVPAYLSGNYYLVFRTNNSGNLYEGPTGKANNTASKLINIQLLNTLPQSDLFVSLLKIPDTALLGQSISADYAVKNIGSNPAIGSLTNAFYLSANKTFEGDLDKLINTWHTPTFLLNPGDSILGKFNGIVNVPKAGNYFGIGRTNILNTINEINIDNNTTVSNDSVNIDAVALTLDVIKQDLLKKDSTKYYKITVGAGLDLLASLTSSLTNQAGSNSMYIAFDRVPTPYDYDAVSIDATTLNQQLLVSNTHAGTYYIRIESREITATQPITILVKALPFSIIKITPNVVGRDEISTMIYGAGFKNNSRIVLRNNAGNQVTEGTIQQFINSTQLKVKWNLKPVAINTYDVFVINPDASEAELPDGLIVEASTGYVLDFIPLTPNQVRRNQVGLFTFKGKNTGNVNIPYIQGDLTIPGYVTVREVIISGNVKKQSTYHQNGYLASENDWYDDNKLKVIPFLSINLAPGEEFTVSFYVNGFQGNTFPIKPRAYGLTTDQFVRKQAAFIDYLRENILAAPQYFGVDNQNRFYKLAAQGSQPFLDTLIQNYFVGGLINPADTFGDRKSVV